VISTALPGSHSGGSPQGLVRTVAVVVPDVLGQDTAEIPFAEDQHVIQALAA
jgi:hypothetical protein